MEYYFSAFKKKKFYHATTQMNFEDLMLSVCFQLTNQIPCFISAFRLYKFTPRNCQKNLIFSEETDISIILEHSSPFQPQAIVRGQKTLVSCLQVQCIMLNSLNSVCFVKMEFQHLQKERSLFLLQICIIGHREGQFITQIPIGLFGGHGFLVVA